MPISPSLADAVVDLLETAYDMRFRWVKVNRLDSVRPSQELPLHAASAPYFHRSPSFAHTHVDIEKHRLGRRQLSTLYDAVGSSPSRPGYPGVSSWQGVCMDLLRAVLSFKFVTCFGEGVEEVNEY
jgi:hypothetical protein